MWIESGFCIQSFFISIIAQLEKQSYVNHVISFLGSEFENASKCAQIDVLHCFISV